jgi:DNA-3-methyladenine glycosylase
METVVLSTAFFQRDVLEVAPDLIGKIIVRRFEKGEIRRYRITETEAYRGEEDIACHASKGRTHRTEVMYHPGGKVYVYLIYGMYWMLNLVTGEPGNPCAVLIRGIEGFNGPGKVGRELDLDKTFYGEEVATSERIWIESDGSEPLFTVSKRIGVEYAGDEWAEKPWRFVAKGNK